MRAVAYGAAALVAALAVGRLLGLPVFLAAVASGSMSPALNPLDLVVAVRGDYGVGDVVVWCSAPMYCVVHRVVAANGSAVVTKGDANPAPDPPVSPGLVRGVVVLSVPRHVWIPLALVPVAYVAVRGGRERGLGVSRGAAAAYAFLLLYAVFSALMAMAPVAPALVEGLEVPSVELVRAGYSGGQVYAVYSLRGVEVGVCWAARWRWATSRLTVRRP